KPSPERAPAYFQTALAALDRLVGAVSEALALSSSWGILAGPTPAGFDHRLGAIRRDLCAALEALNGPELEQIARHAFFMQPSYAQISGLVLLQGTTGADIRGVTRLTDRFEQWAQEPATTPQGREDRLRQMLVMMLYRQPWQVPLLRDLADLPAAGGAAYLGWLNQSPILCRAGDEAAYAGFVLRYMEWLERHLSADRPLAQVLLVGQAIGSLDLGKLLLIDQPLRAVQDRRNRLLTRLALREGCARGQVRATDGSEGRIRIGVLCRTFDKGPDSEAVVAFFRAFDPARYDIRAYSIGLRDRVGGQDDAFERLFHATIQQATVLENDAAHIRRRLIFDNLDVFLFANATTYGIRDLDKALFHRVAPVQAVLNSHLPMPLGYPSFDAFITGKAATADMDVPQEDYCETLIRRPGPVINYLSSLQPRADKGLTRADFGLAQDDVVAMTAGSLAKLGHECLSTMMRAVKDIPRGRLLIAPYNPGWAGRSLAIPFNRQIAQTAAEVGLDPDRITVLGEMTVAETEAALGLADIYLNPFPHGGATMMHLALVYGKPAVTLRRRSTRSIDQFLLSALGFDDLLAQTPQDYVTL
ncbi:MAG: hypothetical protein U1D06_15075, partial [Paracoccaceae bacterium]|nr:hypothetical protein [Paracoccaceae bacterium]